MGIDDWLVKKGTRGLGVRGGQTGVKEEEQEEQQPVTSKRKLKPKVGDKCLLIQLVPCLKNKFKRHRTLCKVKSNWRCLTP